MNAKNTAIMKYYKQLTKLISYSDHSAWFDRIQTGLEEFAADHPDCSYEDIVEEFGTPLEVADSILPECSASDLRKNRRLQKKKIFIAGLAAVIGAFLVAFVIAAVRSKDQTATHAIIEYHEIIIEEETQ